MATEKNRVTLYIDDDVHREIKVFAEEINMSLSAMTRLGYVFIMSIWNLDKSYRYQLEGLKAAYPDGLSEEHREEAARRYAMMRDQVLGQWWNYLGGYTRGIGKSLSLSDTDRQVVSQMIGLFARLLEASYGVAEFLGTPTPVQAGRPEEGDVTKTGEEAPKADAV